MKFSWFNCMLGMMLCGACSSGGGGEEDVIPSGPEPGKLLPITLTCSAVNYEVLSRATDFGFEKNDAIGLFVVNYQNGSAGTLQQSGNHVNNMRFVYNSQWTPDEPIYWLDNQTKADFYIYYPYSNTVTVSDYKVNIPSDQSTLAAYKQGDFLWGKTAGVAPKSEAVSITAHHVFSAVQIQVKAGNGFTEETLAAADVQVRLNGIYTQTTVNLSNGNVAVSGDKQKIIPYKEGDIYKAIIAPQTVVREGLVTITVDGRDYNLTQGTQDPEMTFEAGHRHTFTITVSKTSNGVNVDIGGWDEDGVDHGGVAE